MNIQPIKTEPAPLLAKPKAAPVKETREETVQDSVKSSVPESLLQALKNEPEVRADEVSRGTALVNQPNYPSDELLQKLAQLFVNDARHTK